MRFFCAINGGAAACVVTAVFCLPRGPYSEAALAVGVLVGALNLVGAIMGEMP